MTTEMIRLYEGDRVELGNLRGMGKKPAAKWTATLWIRRGDAYAKAHKPPKAAVKLAKLLGKAKKPIKRAATR